MEKKINNLHKNIKYIGIIAKKSLQIGSSIDFIAEILKKHNIEILLERETAEFFGRKGYEFGEILSKTKIIITLGGDGTLISVARNLAKRDAFILGIHAGTLGFLTDILLEEFSSFMSEFLRGEYEIERPFMLEVFLEKRDGEVLRSSAFNDVVISRKNVSSMAKIEAFLNKKYFNTYYGDGVIISSASGSTAYNMSANGPIIYPLSDVFCVTPICSHSLTQRPLILPREYFLSFKNGSNSEICVIVDGQDIFDMDEFISVEVRMGGHRATLIRHKGRDYFEVLKEKLRWGH